MSRPQTPPHEPKYGVHVAAKTITDIIEQGFPGAKLVSIEQLEHQSYNNRLYFLKVTAVGDSSIFTGTDETETELVLKANGRFFGADKVQNEVGCLRIMQQYCSDVPTPRVLAWSEDGSNVVIAKPTSSEKKSVSLHIEPADNTHGGWVLLSRLPGKPVSAADLDQPTMLDVAKQLGSMAASWRSKIPPQRCIGNIQFHASVHESDPELVIGSEEARNQQSFVVRGVLMDDIKISTPMATVRELYQKKLEQRLKDLSNSDTYKRNRGLIPKVRSFIDDGVPRLNIDTPAAETSPGGFILTHYDLSPRNILVSGSPPKITGIVDFEFAGFFSEPEEFLNDSVGNDGDWDQTVYDAYLTQLEANGTATPRNGIRKDLWGTVHSLEKLAENIAPWWLPGPHKGAELEAELARAEQHVLDHLEKLNAMIQD